LSAEPRSEVMCETLYWRRGARRTVRRAYKSVVRAEGMKRPRPLYSRDLGKSDVSPTA
jgi:hypothetical protein